MPRSDGSVVIEARVDVAKADKDLAKLKGQIQKTEDDIADIQEKRKKASEDSVFKAAELDVEKAKLKSMRQELEEIRAVAKDVSFSQGTRDEAKLRIPSSSVRVSEQAERVRLLQAEYNKIESSVARYNAQLDNASQKLTKQKQQAGELQKQTESVSNASIAMAEAHKKAQKSMQKFSLRLREVVRSALVFTLITQSLSKLREWTSNIINTNEEARASIAKLKGALLTLAQPLVDVLIPAFISFVDILTKIVSVAAQLVSMLFGTTVEKSKAAAEALNEQVEAINGVEDAAKSAGKSLAAFDEINKLSSDTSATSTEPITADFSFDTSETDSQLQNILGLIEAVGAGFLAWKISDSLNLGLGDTLWLTVSIYSAVQLAQEVFDAWTNGVDMSNITGMLASTVGLALGLAMAFGQTAAGAGVLVAGLLMLVTGFHDAMESGWNLENTLLSVWGVVLTGLGLTLIAGGSLIPMLISSIAALLLALTVAAGNGEDLIAGVQSIMEGFTDFFLGIFTGNIERAIGGVGKIFEGLKTVFFAVIDSIEYSLNSFLTWLDEKTGGKIHGFIEELRVRLSNFVGVVKNMLGTLLDAVQQILSGIVKFVSGVFTNDWDLAWEGVMDVLRGIRNGIASILEGVINSIINGINNLIRQLNKISFSVPDWVPALGGKSFGFNITPIQKITIPRLAQGAVIPPNQEFLAVLGDQTSGTNIEAPLSTIKQAMLEALREAGSTSENGTYTFIVNLDGREVARNQYKHLKNLERSFGY